MAKKAKKRVRNPQAEVVHRRLGDEIRTRAQRQGMRLEDVAVQAGRSPSYMWKVLSGESSPSLEWLCDIAEVLGCGPGALLPKRTARR